MPYFDWNATAPLLPEARQAWLDASERYWANPSSPHRPGVQARLALEEARGYLAAVLGVDDDQVIFTSGATEAINGFLAGVYRSIGERGDIWISAVEHPAVKETARAVWGDAHVKAIPVDADGSLDLDWLTDGLRQVRPALVAVMAANNETGILLPWESVLEICQSHGVPCFCDTAQWMGKMPVADWSGFAGTCIAGHKFGGPRGVGCLVLGKDWHGMPLQRGGAQEMGSRSGTENVAGCLAMVEAFRNRASSPVPDRELRDQFERELESLWPGEVAIHGQRRDRLWNTCSVSLPVYRANRWVSRLDKKGFQVSLGSACSSGKAGPSPVLQAMGIVRESIQRTIRISSGWETTAQDWASLLETLGGIREELDRGESAGGPVTVIEI